MSSLPMTLTTPEGVQITVKQGCITKEKVDVIINSTREDLELNAGMLSAAILVAAGSKVQTEARSLAPRGVRLGQVVVTSGGRLPAFHIYHGVLTPWAGGSGSAEKDLRTFLRCVLEKGDEEMEYSMAIPAISTGILETPGKVVAKVMHEEILDFSKSYLDTTLKDIRIVLINGPLVQEFTSYFSTFCGGSSNKRPASFNGNPSPAKRQKSVTYNTAAGGTTAGIPQTSTGVATQSQALKGSTSSASNQPLPVLHSHFTRSVIQVVSALNSHKPSKQSQDKNVLLSFTTAKGGVTVNIKKGQIAKAEADGIVNVVTTNLKLSVGAISSSILASAGKSVQKACNIKAPSGLRYGSFVNTDGGLLPCRQIYHGSLPNWSKANAEKHLRRLVRDILDKADALHCLSSIAMPSMGTGLMLGYPPGIVAKCMIEAIEEHDSTDYSPKYSFASDPHSDDDIDVDGDDSDSEDDDSSSDDGSTESDMDITSSESSDDDEASNNGNKLSFPTVPKSGTVLVERSEFPRSMGNLDTVDIILFDKDHKTISAFTQFVSSRYNLGSGNSTASAPVAKDTTEAHAGDHNNNGTDSDETSSSQSLIPLPDSWTAMEAAELYTVVALDPQSTEYKQVAVTFIGNGGSTNIKQIERVQCPNMYQLFSVKRAQMENANASNPSFNVEQLLYHGTTKDSLDGINLFGFNRSFSGKNGRMFGYGSYFAKYADYSQKFSPADKDGCRYMYQCRVLTGEYTLGSEDLKMPPARDKNKPGILYDSVVNDLKTPSIFVVFYDAQAYPEYLITFKD